MCCSSARSHSRLSFFFFNDTATTEIYTLSLHDALPMSEMGRAAGTDLMINSRGVAVADFWNRGALDIAVASSTNRHALLKNDVGGKRNWLGVELVGTKSNRDAGGARVSIVVKGQPQMREVVLGDGYGSQNSLRQYFGLSDAASVDELVVGWARAGGVQKVQKVAANRIVQ